MKKPIKFIYALLIITIIGSGFSLWIINKNNNPEIISAILKKDKNYNNPWEGEWVRIDSTNFDQSILEISNVTEEGFNFSIEAVNGNMGSIGVNMEEGKDEPVTAFINGNTAKFTYKFDEEFDEEKPCIVNFAQLQEGVLEVNESGCDYFKGNAVYFGGNYKRGGSILEITTKSTDLFSGKEEAYKEFTKLVGAYIKDFDGTVGIEWEDYDEALKADIGNFFVPHNAMTKSIIIIGPNNKIWAAFSNWPEGEDDMVIQYFTNVPEYKNKIPTKIKEWNNDNYKVIYNR